MATSDDDDSGIPQPQSVPPSPLGETDDLFSAPPAPAPAPAPPPAPAGLDDLFAAPSPSSSGVGPIVAPKIAAPISTPVAAPIPAPVAPPVAAPLPKPVIIPMPGFSPRESSPKLEGEGDEPKPSEPPAVVKAQAEAEPAGARSTEADPVAAKPEAEPAGAKPESEPAAKSEPDLPGAEQPATKAEAEQPAAKAEAEPAPEKSEAEPSAAKPEPAAKPEAVAAKSEEAERPRPAIDSSALRRPVHSRKTSTQAHVAVGEFGVFPGDDEDPQDEAPPVESRPAAARSSGIGVGPLIGLGLGAALLVMFLLSKQGDPKSESPPKPNRSEPAKTEAGEPKPEAKPDPTPEAKPDPVVEPSGSESDTGEDPAETGGDEETTGTTGGVEPPPTGADVDPRDPKFIPAGTPEANAKAFSKLPVGVNDGPPVGGIGQTGIHVDSIATGNAYQGGECQNQTNAFSIASDKEVSVCFRIVHGRQEETVRVLWDKDGRTSRRGNVRIRDIHAYKTRAYLELRPEYAGSWRVRVVSDDDVELASMAFEIAP